MWTRAAAQELWGWRPFFWWILLLCAILLLIDLRKKHARTRRWIGLSVVSGLILSVGFPPSPMLPLVFIGFVPLLAVESEISKEKGGVARWTVFKYSFLAFLVWNVCTTWWILNTSFIPGIVANALNAIFMATVFTAFHQLRHLLGQRMHWLILAALWMSFEYLHLNWEISWPWLTLGNYFAQYPSWVQWYEYTGVFGGSLWVLAVNYWIWNLYQGKLNAGHWDRKGLVGVLAVILLPIAFGIVRYATYHVPEGDTEIAVLQPNFEPHFQKFDIPERVQMRTFLRLSDSIVTNDTEYLVWPETSFGYIPLNTAENDYRIEAMRELVSKYPGLKLITGIASYRIHDGPIDIPTLRTQVRNGDTMYLDIQNTAIQVVQNEPLEPYFKSKLVPGPEIFPYSDVLGFLKPVIDLMEGTAAGHTMQPERAVFSSDISNAAPVICYESIYGDYVAGYIKKGADILYIVTNDGWWDNTPGHVQHLKLGALRAVEHRRPIARSANTGISCFINERGDILQPTKYGETVAIRGKLKAQSDVYTFYTRWGDVIARISLGMAGLFVVLGVARRWQQRVGD